MNRLSEMMSAAIRQFVPVDACDNRMPDAKTTDSFSDVTRLVRVEPDRFTFRHCAEAAMPSADVAQYHKGRCAFAPALEDVRAAGLLADRMQTQIVDHPRYAVECLTGADSDF